MADIVVLYVIVRIVIKQVGINIGSMNVVKNHSSDVVFVRIVVIEKEIC